MTGGNGMIRLSFLLLIVFAVQVSLSFRVTQGIDEAQRAVTEAYNAGAKDKAPYLYSKAKAYKDISFILASEADDIGSKIFAIRTMNYASKAISAAFTGRESAPDTLEDIRSVVYEPVYRGDYYFPENNEEDVISHRVKSEASFIEEEAWLSLYKRLDFLRKNRGLHCSPKELGRAEAFYDALIYELRKEEPNSALVLKFFNEVSTESKIAESKLRVAMENELECYTGRKVALVPEPEKKAEEKKSEEKPRPKEVWEQLKITARIHFDFDKYEIKREYIPILNEVVKTLKENPFIKVRIEGFTDKIGPKEYNEKLALKRAKAVKDYLVRNGVPEEKIEIVGFGKERFIASNETKVGRLTNRRVEFIVLKIQE